MCQRISIGALCLVSLLNCSQADESPAARRIEKAKQHHFQSQQRTGMLVPLYVYPENIHKNTTYNALIELKRRHETVPIWVILNPASGPGDQVDANYTKAIDRLYGSGCLVLGYVSTSYGKRKAAEAKGDIDQWLKLYPRIQGIFFDEMIYEDSPAGAKHQIELNEHARRAGCWPTVANPGAETPERYFASDAADVIVIHEGDKWPPEERLKGDYFGGYSDYPPAKRAVLLHSQNELDKAALKMARKYVRWVYSTDAPYRPNDPKAANPWDRLSKYLDSLCEEFEK